LILCRDVFGITVCIFSLADSLGVGGVGTRTPNELLNKRQLFVSALAVI